MDRGKLMREGGGVRVTNCNNLLFSIIWFFKLHVGKTDKTKFLKMFQDDP